MTVEPIDLGLSSWSSEGASSEGAILYDFGFWLFPQPIRRYEKLA